MTQMITASLGDGPAAQPDDGPGEEAGRRVQQDRRGGGKAGIQQGLHTEGFELSMVDGKRVYDMLFDLLDPKLVKFQFQMSTIANGLVAADYFTKHPGRFISMHLQDVDMNAPLPLRRRRGAAAGRGRGGGRPQKPMGQGRSTGSRRSGGEDRRGQELLRRAELDLTKESVAFLRR